MNDEDQVIAAETRAAHYRLEIDRLREALTTQDLAHSQAIKIFRDDALAAAREAHAVKGHLKTIVDSGATLATYQAAVAEIMSVIASRRRPSMVGWGALRGGAATAPGTWKEQVIAEIGRLHAENAEVVKAMQVHEDELRAALGVLRGLADIAGTSVDFLPSLLRGQSTPDGTPSA